MIYLISDIHGDFFHFRKMLEKISFTGADLLYVLGDVVDKGQENLRLLSEIRETGNMLLLKGNHEYLCERYLDKTLPGEVWDSCGGSRTREEVDALTEPEKSELLRYFKGLPVYQKITVCKEEYFLTHSGYWADCEIRHPETGLVDIEESVREAVRVNQERYLFSDDIHYIPASLQFDRKIIVGHYPAPALQEWGKARIFHGKKYTDIDTGNESRKEGGRLACLCLDDGREFYV